MVFAFIQSVLSLACCASRPKPGAAASAKSVKGRQSVVVGLSIAGEPEPADDETADTNEEQALSRKSVRKPTLKRGKSVKLASPAVGDFGLPPPADALTGDDDLAEVVDLAEDARDDAAGEENDADDNVIVSMLMVDVAEEVVETVDGVTQKQLKGQQSIVVSLADVEAMEALEAMREAQAEDGAEDGETSKDAHQSVRMSLRPSVQLAMRQSLRRKTTKNLGPTEVGDFGLPPPAEPSPDEATHEGTVAEAAKENKEEDKTS